MKFQNAVDDRVFSHIKAVAPFFKFYGFAFLSIAVGYYGYFGIIDRRTDDTVIIGRFFSAGGIYLSLYRNGVSRLYGRCGLSDVMPVYFGYLNLVIGV